MYNIYVKEKQDKEKKQKEREALKYTNYRKKFKSNTNKYNLTKNKIEQIPIMYENYEKRVKDFITDVN